MSESDVYRRQNLISTVDPRAVRVKVMTISNTRLTLFPFLQPFMGLTCGIRSSFGLNSFLQSRPVMVGDLIISESYIFFFFVMVVATATGKMLNTKSIVIVINDAEKAFSTMQSENSEEQFFVCFLTQV